MTVEQFRDYLTNLLIQDTGVADFSIEIDIDGWSTENKIHCIKSYSNESIFIYAPEP